MIIALLLGTYATTTLCVMYLVREWKHWRLTRAVKKELTRNRGVAHLSDLIVDLDCSPGALYDVVDVLADKGHVVQAPDMDNQPVLLSL